MAIPPEPIEEVLPLADAAVIAKVTRVISADPQKPFPTHEPGVTGAGGEVARQVVELQVQESLFGQFAEGARLQAIKPAGAYTLSAGNGGPFLLELAPGGEVVILGRYGPDTYSRRTIERAVQAAG